MVRLVMLLSAALCAAAPALPVEWDTTFRVTIDTCQQVLGLGSQRSVAVDGSGNVHVAWLDSRTVPSQVWYRRFDAASRQWSPETALTARSAACERPSIACDAVGDVHVAWHSGFSPDYGIWYKRRDASTRRWLAETLLVAGTASRVRQFPALACRPGGQEVHVAWVGTPDTGLGRAVFHIERTPDSGWGAVTQLTQTSRSREKAAVAVDSSDGVTVAWSGLDFSGQQSQICCERRVAGTWEAVELVPSLGRARTQSDPSIVTEGGTGVVHAVWSGGADGSSYERIQYCRRAVGGWGAAQAVGPSARFDQSAPSVAWRSNGFVGVAWCAADDSSPTVRQVQYCERDTSGLWSAVERLTALGSGNVDYPTMTADRWDRLHLAWQGAPGRNYDVFYRSGTPAGSPFAEHNRTELRRVRVWPVPAHARANVEGAGRVTLRDVAGRAVGCPKRSAGSSVRLDLRGLAAGVYLVEVDGARPGRLVVR